jgi:hypothetical protein
MIETKTIIVPTELSDVKLHQMITYNSLKEDMDEVQRQLEAVAIFCDLTMSDVNAIPYDTLKHITTKIANMLEQKPTFVQRFEFGGVKYGFVPNLDELSTGEFIDIETYQKNPQDLWKVLSIIYRPIMKKGQNNRYEIEPYNAELNPAFKELDANTAFGALLFFWTIGIALLNCTQRYLEGAKSKEVRMNFASHKNGDGLEWSTDLLTEITSTLTKYIESPFQPLYCGRLTKATLRKWNKKQLEQNEQ